MIPGWVSLAESGLAAMRRYTEELAARLGVTPDVYATDRDRQLMVERLCQLVIECAIDTNGRLMDGLGQPPPESARESFDAVEEAGILGPQLTAAFRDTFVGFGNRLVHAYERIDNAITYRTAGRLVEAGRDYVAAVGAYLAAILGDPTDAPVP